MSALNAGLDVRTPSAPIFTSHANIRAINAVGSESFTVAMVIAHAPTRIPAYKDASA